MYEQIENLRRPVRNDGEGERGIAGGKSFVGVVAVLEQEVSQTGIREDES